MTNSHRTDQASLLMIEHPGWFTTPDGRAQRVFRSGDTRWVLTSHITGATFAPTVEIIHQGSSEVDVTSLISCFDPALLPTPFRDTPTIRDYGRLHRVRSTDLWESLVLQLLRARRIRATQANLRYRRLCTTMGDKFTTRLGTVLSLPRPEAIAAARGDDWDELAALPWIRPVQNTAEAFLERQDTWSHVPFEVLHDLLRDLPHIAEHSATAIVADLTNDFSHYEFVEFGTPGRWDQFSHELKGAYSPLQFQTVWKEVTPRQRSTLAALSIDWVSRRFSTARDRRHQRPEPSESTDKSITRKTGPHAHAR